METIKNPINLPELPKFNEAKIQPGELLDLSLAAAGNPIYCFTSDVLIFFKKNVDNIFREITSVS